MEHGVAEQGSAAQGDDQGPQSPIEDAGEDVVDVVEDVEEDVEEDVVDAGENVPWWGMYTTCEQINGVIQALNPKGIREKHLHATLQRV
jgi:hypothetical protein